MLRWCGAIVGKNVEIMSTAKFYGGYELIIGDAVFIGYDTMIFGHNDSTIIEVYAKIGSIASVVTGSHKYTTFTPSIAGEGIFANIRICKGARVETYTLICPGKTVVKMSVICCYR